jgi:integrase
MRRRVTSDLERRVRRRGTHLFEAGYKVATLLRYKGEVSSFVRWWERQDEYDLCSDTIDEFDVSISYYLSYLWKTGKGKSKAACLLAGIALYVPAARGKLPICTRLLRNWSKAEPSVPYPPLTREAAAAIAIRMAADGHPDFGVGVLVAFDCFLRISELVGLKVKDFADAHDSRTGSCDMVLRLGSTKTGPEQSTLVRDPQVQQLLRLHVCGRPSDGPIFGFSAASFRRVFKSTCETLALDPSFTPHSLRHGAATAAFMRGLSLETIMQLGRWRQSTSTAHYVQTGRALLLKMKVPRSVAELGSEVLSDVVGCFEEMARVRGKLDERKVKK